MWYVVRIIELLDIFVIIICVVYMIDDIKIDYELIYKGECFKGIMILCVSIVDLIMKIIVELIVYENISFGIV